MSTTTLQQSVLAGASIRWLIRRDMEQVMAIENASYDEGQQRWSEADLCRVLRERNCIGMVTEVAGEVVAFMVYGLYDGCTVLLNCAVHPHYRRKGLGKQIVQKMKGKATDRQQRLVALVPELLLPQSQGLWEKYGVEVELTHKKGERPTPPIPPPVFSAMTTVDVDEVQLIENAFMKAYGREPRDIGKRLTMGGSGIVARDKASRSLMGYALYRREVGGVEINGEFGILVEPKYRKRGVGRALWQELGKLGLPITAADIYLNCKSQVGFLRAMGVPVPTHCTVTVPVPS